MKIHEFQAKGIISKYGVAVPQSIVVKSVDEAVAAAKKLPGEVCVVKAQIHAGGRGKGGGVKVSKGIEAVKTNATDILGMQLVTKQTGPEGQEVKTLLIEEGMDIKSELYFSIVVDRDTQKIMLIASTEGGMNIEEVAEETPELILTESIDPALGLRPFQAQRLAYGLKLEEYGPKMPRQAAAFFMGLYEAFVAEDCDMLEINPVVVTGDNRILALDCKMSFDDNALMRHKGTVALRDLDEEDASEIEASKWDLNFIKLDGTIGCMVNGAGLAMATMDIIESYGAFPANFLDVGGTATEERVEAAFKLITQDKNVKTILINIFGGIVRCDVIANGVVAAFKSVKLDIPVVVRLEGTNAELAAKIIEESGLKDKLIMVKGFGPAAKKAVEVAQ
ncbi:MAG: ADP-forming succinate--CoA ligase subunit beta [SAR324 cluster bacterium]|uniref:Succinate--CoA ligase [ADP-forming] subunit beta n=1 Tax=SAR324 cluster bacterium TaxID=2024889 RepID=A0A2A4T2M8_9DELT|nr:MAG: ADP-forming succinate--CoA ligase subunit beta [SAR324 cluster bacterium]